MDSQSNSRKVTLEKYNVLFTPNQADNRRTKVYTSPTSGQEKENII